VEKRFDREEMEGNTRSYSDIESDEDYQEFAVKTQVHRRRHGINQTQFESFRKQVKRNSLQLEDREIELMFDSLGKIDSLTQFKHSLYQNSKDEAYNDCMDENILRGLQKLVRRKPKHKIL
jgi:hypothetical protein